MPPMTTSIGMTPISPADNIHQATGKVHTIVISAAVTSPVTAYSRNCLVVRR